MKNHLLSGIPLLPEAVSTHYVRFQVLAEMSVKITFEKAVIYV
jgi:hypothetical protein